MQHATTSCMQLVENCLDRPICILLGSVKNRQNLGTDIFLVPPVYLLNFSIASCRTLNADSSYNFG